MACEYCDDSAVNLLNACDEDVDVDVFVTDKGELELYVDNVERCLITKRLRHINYCPMCGRKLKQAHGKRKDGDSDDA